MKKILFLFAATAMLTLQGCDGPEGPRGDAGPPAEVFEMQNVNFGYDTTNGYNIYQTLTPNIGDADIVMVYRLSGTIDSQTPIWEQIPETMQVGEGDEVYYDFDFSREDFTIYADANFDLATTPYISNQTFRVVIISGYFSSGANQRKASLSYNDLMKSLNLTEADVKVLK
jgi:hypothetical protein